MKKILFCLFTACFISAVLCAAENGITLISRKKEPQSKRYHPPSQQNSYRPLFNRMPKSNKRYATFDLAFQLMEQRNAKIIVETGTARNGNRECRGDRCSTLLFAEWAKLHSAQVFSVGMDSKELTRAKRMVNLIDEKVNFYSMDHISFLNTFDQIIDFLYLDSCDFDVSNPLSSQQQLLNEIIAAFPHLVNHSIVMIDDCDLPHGGKGKLAIEWLKERGWKILTSQYQTILIKELLDDVCLENCEKKIFSQNGEDGVIETLIYLLGSPTKYYVEFGVENGQECNTRYLRETKGWQGLLMDGRYEDLNINLHREYITAENINELFEKYHVPYEFDLLSIDIDFNDFYIWNAIDSKYRPSIVVIEYNATHLPNEDKVVMYNPNYWWDYTNYCGASILSLSLLGTLKGYTLVYAENRGVNLFFVRDDVLKNSQIHFLHQNQVSELYKFPKYGQGPNGGHDQDPHLRSYLKAADILK